MKGLKITLTLVIVFLLLSPQAFAQNNPNINPASLTWRKTHDGAVRCVAYSPDGKALASGGTDDAIRLWEVSTSDSLGTLEGHGGDVNSVAFSPDGEWIASGSDDGTVRLWKQSTKGDHTTWMEHQELEIKATFLFIFTNPLNNNGKSVAFNRDSDILACGTSGDKVIVWFYSSIQDKWGDSRTLDGHLRDVNSVAFSSDDSLLASADDGGWMHLWKTGLLGVQDSDPLSDAEYEFGRINSITSPSEPKYTLVRDPLAHDRLVETDTAIEFAIGTENGARILYKIGDSYSSKDVEGSTGDVRSVAFSPSGDVLLSGQSNGSILVSDGTWGDYRDLKIRRPDAGAVNSIAFHENTVVLGREDGSVQQLAYTESTGLAVSGISLETPTRFISELAFGENSTYFILNGRHPRLKIVGTPNISYGTCLITLNLPGVPEIPIQPSDLTDPSLTDLSEEEVNLLVGPPAYFMHPLHTPLQRLNLRDEKYATLRNHAVKKGWLRAGLREGGRIVGSLAGAKIGIAVGGILGTALPGVGTIVGAAIGGFVGAGTGSVVGYLVTGGSAPDPEDIGENELEILASTADPIIVFSHALDDEEITGTDPPKGKLETLFFIRQNLRNSPIIPVTIQQDFRIRDAGIVSFGETYTARFEGSLNLVSRGFVPDGQAAPSQLSIHGQPMALSDYAPFQRLSPEVQEYLLRQLGEFGTPREVTEWQIPETTSLLPNYPNPFNPETWLPYQLSESADVTLTIYDIQGRVVRDLDLGHQRAGMYHSRSRAAHWDGKNAQGESVASGLYFYTLKADDFTATRKMLIRK